MLTHSRQPDAADSGASGGGRSPGTAPSSRWRRQAAAAVAVALLALVGCAVAFHATGGRWLAVTTPSMGTTAPVGTLVLTRPAAVKDIGVGDIVVFHPPTESGSTFTHRVVAVQNGRLSTRGDINGSDDPSSLAQGDLVGRVVARVPVLGRLVRVLPMLAVGFLVVWAATAWYAAPRLRTPLRLLGAALLLLLATTLTRPFLGAEVIASVPAPGMTTVSLVSTGLLPLQARAGSGRPTALDLRNGQTGVLRVIGAPGGHVSISLHLHLPRWGWSVLVLFWFSPLLWVLVSGLGRVPA